jgi:hypothetical protein
MKAEGPFFRPMFQDWLTSFFVCDGWEWYSHCRGRGSNQYASSPRSYFGLDVLSFAARCARRRSVRLALEEIGMQCGGALGTASPQAARVALVTPKQPESSDLMCF